MSYSELNDIITKTWENECDSNVYMEFFWYMVMTEIMRSIFEMKDEEITKESILELARRFVKDKDVRYDARALSECFEEIL